jgi:anti-sigma regulatory factor (Ser/Thr protein kinase)
MLTALGFWVHQGEARIGRSQIAQETVVFQGSARVSSSARGVDDGLSLRLSGGPDAAARARRALSQLRADIDPPLMETLRLLVTELVANSIRHTRSESVVLRIVVGRSAVLTEVTDEGPGFDPAEAPRPGTNDSGWGLFLVERLAHRWGVAHEDQATRVWFELLRG